LQEKGIYTEETKGELKAASQIYQEIVDDPRADRSPVARAQLLMFQVNPLLNRRNRSPAGIACTLCHLVIFLIIAYHWIEAAANHACNYSLSAL